MKRRRLGPTGIHVNRFGLGTMVLGPWGTTDSAACTRIVHRALDAGVNPIDSADTGWSPPALEADQRRSRA